MIDAKPERTYETVSGMPQRDSAQARRLNGKALELVEAGQLGEAKLAADNAIIADVDHAPAHNTLGKIYFRQGNFYLAAWEFEFAIRLYPDNPDYHNNLGLVYEEAEKLTEAISQYQLAVDLEPDNHHFVSNLTRARIRTDECSPETRRLLEQVVFMDARREWKNWAQSLLNTTHLDIPSAETPAALSPLGEFEFTPESVLPPKPDPVIELTPSLTTPGSKLEDSEEPTVEPEWDPGFLPRG